jgi:hypothetical protein
VALAGVSYSVWWSSFQLAEGLARCLHLRPHVDAGTSSTVAARFWLTLAKLGVYSIRRESYDAAVQAAALYRELHDDQRLFEALTFAAVQGTRFATVAEMEAEIDKPRGSSNPSGPRASGPSCNSPAASGSRASVGSRRRSLARDGRWPSVAKATLKWLRYTRRPTSR